MSLAIAAPTTERRTAIAAAGPARFFTIRDVLADIDSRSRDGDTAAPNATRAGVHGEVASAAGPPELSIGTLRGSEPFGLSTFRAPEGLLWYKWRGVERNLAAERNAIAGCLRDPSRCSPGASRFLRIVDAVRLRQGFARFEEANRTINLAVRYTSDVAQHNELDRWSTPLATLSAGLGDCEDYAIAKYALLKEAGVAGEDLRLVLVRDRRAGEDHAVLAVRFEDRWLILDNRYGAVLRDVEIRHFVPLYAINSDGVALLAAPYLSPVAPTAPAPAARDLSAVALGDATATPAPAGVFPLNSEP